MLFYKVCVCRNNFLLLPNLAQWKPACRMQGNAVRRGLAAELEVLQSKLHGRNGPGDRSNELSTTSRRIKA